MNKRVLFVDDEPNVLQSIKRNLNKVFDVDTAPGGAEALEKIAQNEPYAVIVSDMRMPGMSGVEFLSQAKRQAPDSVRIMLTGNADQQTAVDAVNQGDIFRFLNKPCESKELSAAIDGALRQYELITAEKELLEQTLQGSIDALANVLAMANPEVFGSTSRSKQRVQNLALEMGLAEGWQYESAAMLSKIGCIAVSEPLVLRKLRGQPLEEEELQAYSEHARVGAQLVSSIPRMESVAEAIQYQEKNFDGSGYPQDTLIGESIPLGARILKIVQDFDTIEVAGAATDAALETMQQAHGKYDPEILAAFARSVQSEATVKTMRAKLNELNDSMVIAIDVKTQNSLLLIAKGQTTSLSVRRHLYNFYERGLIGNEVIVYDNS